MENKSEVKEKKKLNENIIALIMIITIAVIGSLLLFIKVSDVDEDGFVYSEPEEYGYIDTWTDSRMTQEEIFVQAIRTAVSDCNGYYYRDWTNDSSVEMKDYLSKDRIMGELNNYEAISGECTSYEMDEFDKEITMQIKNLSSERIHKVIINSNSGEIKSVN